MNTEENTEDNNFYALWYTFKDGVRSTNAISTTPKLLTSLHKKSIGNLDGLYIHYEKNIINITIEPIECYQYNSSSQNLEIYNPYNNIENGNFYATQYHPNEPNKIEEVLIYLTDEQYDIWKSSYASKIQSIKYSSFFCTEYVSERVYPNIYYEDGIMNAYTDGF